MKFLHSDIGSTGIIPGVGPANGGRRNGPHWPRPYPIWSPIRGVPIPRPQVTRRFWQVYNKAVQLTHWNTVKVTEHKSMQHDNEVFAQWYRVNRDYSGCGTSQWGRRNGVPHWPSPHPICSLRQGVPIPHRMYLKLHQVFTISTHTHFHTYS